MILDMIPLHQQIDPYYPSIDTRQIFSTNMEPNMWVEDHYLRGAKIGDVTGGFSEYKTIEKYGECWVERLWVAGDDEMDGYINGDVARSSTTLFPVQIKRYCGSHCQLLRPMDCIYDWHCEFNHRNNYPRWMVSYNRAVQNATEETLYVKPITDLMVDHLCSEPTVRYTQLIDALENAKPWERALVYNRLMNLTNSDLSTLDPITLSCINGPMTLETLQPHFSTEFCLHQYNHCGAHLMLQEDDWSFDQNLQMFDDTCKSAFYDLIIYISALYYAELSITLAERDLSISVNHPVLPDCPELTKRIASELKPLLFAWIRAKYKMDRQVNISIVKTWHENIYIHIQPKHSPSEREIFYIDIPIISLCTHLMMG